MTIVTLISSFPHPIPDIPTLIPQIPTPIPCILTLILCIPIIPTLVPYIPAIPLITFPDSQFEFLQIADFWDTLWVTLQYLY